MLKIINNSKTIQQHILLSVIGAFIVLLAVIGINLYQQVQDISDSKLPVVVNMRAVQKIETDEYMDLRVFGDKKRQCGAPIAWTAIYGNHTFHEFIFLDDLTDEGYLVVPVPRLISDSIDFGWWRFQPNPENIPIIIKIFHKCGDFTVVTEFVLNPLDIKE